MDKALILDRIIKYYKFKSDAEFARHLGITPQNLSKWKTRNTYDAELLYTKCTELNPEWLLTGNEPMLKNVSQEIKNENSDNNNISNNNINGKVNGNITISQNDFVEFVELQKDCQNINKELNERLKTSQSQINILLEILKTK